MHKQRLRDTKTIRWIHYLFHYYIHHSHIPKLVQIELTNQCNYNCKMCYQHCMKRSRGYMQSNMYFKIIDECQHMGVTTIRLDLAGESLLHDQCIEFIRYAKQKNMRVIISTNAYLMNHFVSTAFIEQKIDVVQCSFHGGTREDYKQVMNKDAFEYCLSNIKQLINLKTIHHATHPEIIINAMKNTLNHKNIHRVNTIFKNDQVTIRHNQCSFNPVTMDTDLRLDKTSINRKYPCYQLYDRLVIFWDGQITVCCVDNEGFLTIGHVNEGLRSVFNGKKLRQHRQLHRHGRYPPLCQRCDL